MAYTDDPVHDFNEYCLEKERRADRYHMPTCKFCGERVDFVRIIPIGAVDVNVCPDCLFDRYLHYNINEDWEEKCCNICGADIGVGDEYYEIAGETWCEDCIRDCEKVTSDLF